MLLDAIVLAGGRSSRLSGVPKAQLLWRGATLLQNTVGAALDAGARRVIVVGPAGGSGGGPGIGQWHRSGGVLFVREDPPFGGPAAAIAAGMRALEGPGPDAHAAAVGNADVDADADADAAVAAVLVLACDMPGVASAVDQLLTASPALAASDGQAPHGAILLDASGRRQPLAAIYGRSALADAVAGLRASGTLDGASMRTLTTSLDLLELADPLGSTRDVDTWTDAAEFGIEQPRDAPLADARRVDHERQ
jgi:molybdopterin-guanine dinucleotide biosynthesis protein A